MGGSPSDRCAVRNNNNNKMEAKRCWGKGGEREKDGGVGGGVVTEGMMY